VALLAEKQKKFLPDMTPTDTAIVLLQPMTLRDLRKSIIRLQKARTNA
jgi:hypothetical protein